MSQVIEKEQSPMDEEQETEEQSPMDEEQETEEQETEEQETEESQQPLEFFSGQIFIGDYPPEAAEWCNESEKYFIDEVEPDPETGKRRFQIKPVDPPTEEELFFFLKRERDKRLDQIDYLAMPDYPISEEDKKRVFEYRQALRDLPSQPGAPWDGGGDLTPWPVLKLTKDEEQSSEEQSSEEQSSEEQSSGNEGKTQVVFSLKGNTLHF